MNNTILKRIVIGQVKKAYEKLGVKPINGRFLDCDGNCCPVMAVAKADHGHASMGVLLSAGYNHNYLNDVTYGYDHPQEGSLNPGIADGSEIRRELDAQ